MACVSRPKPPSFWGQTALLLALTLHTGSDAQVDLPPDSLYFDPRYQFDPSPPPFRGQGRAQAKHGNFDPYSSRESFTPVTSKPVKELSLDEALNAFLKTQDPKYYNYYQKGDERNHPDDRSGNPGHPGHSGHSGHPGHPSDPQVAALLKQIDSVGSQQCAANVLAQWNFETNVNEVTQLEAVSTRA
jgi:hypothetical protein